MMRNERKNRIERTSNGVFGMKRTKERKTKQESKHDNDGECSKTDEERQKETD